MRPSTTPGGSHSVMMGAASLSALETQMGALVTGKAPPSGFAGVVSSLQEEYNTLSTQYTTLLQRAQSADPAHAGLFADELMTVMQRLKRKQEQITALSA